MDFVLFLIELLLSLLNASERWISNTKTQRCEIWSDMKQKKQQIPRLEAENNLAFSFDRWL